MKMNVQNEWPSQTDWWPNFTDERRARLLWKVLIHWEQPCVYAMPRNIQCNIITTTPAAAITTILSVLSVSFLKDKLTTTISIFKCFLSKGQTPKTYKQMNIQISTHIHLALSNNTFTTVAQIELLWDVSSCTHLYQTDSAGHAHAGSLLPTAWSMMLVPCGISLCLGKVYLAMTVLLCV